MKHSALPSILLRKNELGQVQGREYYEKLRRVNFKCWILKLYVKGNDAREFWTTVQWLVLLQKRQVTMQLFTSLKIRITKKKIHVHKKLQLFIWAFAGDSCEVEQILLFALLVFNVLCLFFAYRFSKSREELHFFRISLKTQWQTMFSEIFNIAFNLTFSSTPTSTTFVVL